MENTPLTLNKETLKKKERGKRGVNTIEIDLLHSLPDELVSR